MGEYQAIKQKDHSTEPVIQMDPHDNRPVVRSQAGPVDASIDNTVGKRRGRDICGENAVLVKSGNDCVSDERYPVAKGIPGGAYCHVGVA